MLGHDNPQPQEMVLKGSVEGKPHVGSGPSPAGADDREVVSFDGQVLILKWVAPEIAGRYASSWRAAVPGKRPEPRRPSEKRAAYQIEAASSCTRARAAAVLLRESMLA
jgi:hypothetical protein